MALEAPDAPPADGTMTDEQAEAQFDEAAIPDPETPDVDAETEPDVDAKPDAPVTEKPPVAASAAKPDGDPLASARALAQQKIDEANKRRVERMLEESERQKPQPQAPAASDRAPSAGLDLKAIRAEVEADLKSIKPSDLEEVDTFEKFEKEYGPALTNTMLGVAAAVARQMVAKAVAPIMAEANQRRADEEHERFVSTIERDHGIANIRQLESDKEFWGYLDANPGLKSLVESGDVKGTVLTIQAYNAEKGIAAPSAPAAPAPASPRAAAAESVRAKAQSIHRSTAGSRQAPKAAPAREDGDPETDEDAEAIFQSALKRAGG